MQESGQYNDCLYSVPSLSPVVKLVKLVKLDNGALLRERERERDDNSS